MCGSHCGAAVPVTDRRQAIQEDVRFRVLRLLEANPALSQRELAEALGISIGQTHYLLTGLIEKGLVKLGNFAAAEDKRRYAYMLTRKGLAEKVTLTRQFLERRRAEYAALKAEIAALENDRPCIATPPYRSEEDEQ